VTIFARLYSTGFEPVQEPSVKGIYGMRSGGAGRKSRCVRSRNSRGCIAANLSRRARSLPVLRRAGSNTQLDFNVTEPKFELGETAMNEPMLRDMAAQTGGAFFREEDLFKLPT
jgi:hypothetical protein